MLMIIKINIHKNSREKNVIFNAKLYFFYSCKSSLFSKVLFTHKYITIISFKKFILILVYQNNFKT